MKKLFKNLFFVLVSKKPLSKDQAVILMYHSIGDSNRFSAVPLGSFERQMRFLSEKNVLVVSLSELVRRLQSGESLEGAVVITFDDGYKDNVTVAAPILKRYGFPATVFVTAGKVGQAEYLSTEDLASPPSGISIGAHSVSHPKLGVLPKDEARREIAESRRILEEQTGGVCEYFAYPFGNYSAETLLLVRETGFVAALTVKEAVVTPQSDLFALPRMSIDSSTSFSQFCGKVSTAIEWYHALKRCFRSRHAKD